MRCLRGGGFRDCARNDEAVPIVHHDKYRRQLDSRFASGPATRINVGRGHRRGLDGPTMPKPSTKTDADFPQRMLFAGPPCVARRGGGACFVRLRRRRPQADGGHEQNKLPR